MWFLRVIYTLKVPNYTTLCERSWIKLLLVFTTFDLDLGTFPDFMFDLGTFPDFMFDLGTFPDFMFDLGTFPDFMFD